MGFSYHITYSTSVLPNKLRNGFKYTDNWVKYARNLTKYVLLKFMFSKKATNIDKIFTVDLTLCSKTVKISSIFVAFLENTNFKIL